MKNVSLLQSALEHSIKHYKDLHLFLLDIDLKIGIASETELQEFDKSLREMHVKAIDIDQTVTENSTEDSTVIATFENLLNERTLLVKEILNLNEKIVAKANGVNSLIAHDIEMFRNSAAARHGYRQQQDNNGRLVNTTS